MHVAIVHSHFILYWPARLRALAEALRQRGDSLSVIETTSHVGGHVYASRGAASVPHAKCYRLYNEDAPLRSPRQIGRLLLAMLEELQPDAVLATPFAIPEGATSIRWCKARGKIVVVMDDVRAEDVPRSWLVNAAKRAVYRNVDAMLIPAPSHVDNFIRWGVPRERLFFGLDVVDNDWFAKRVGELRGRTDELRLQYGLRRRFFLGLGRQVAKKNWSSLVAAFGLYRRETAKAEWDLVLVGDGPERQRLLSQVASEDIPGVRFAPFASQDDVCIYYALAGACVLPSIMETWGLVVNEAMASGLPVLVSNQCGCCKTVVRDGDNGWSFSPDDTEEMAKLLSRLACLDDRARRTMGENSRAIISEWSPRRFAEGAIEAIEFCRSPGRRGRRSKVGQCVLGLWNGRSSA